MERGGWRPEDHVEVGCPCELGQRLWVEWICVCLWLLHSFIHSHGHRAPALCRPEARCW